MHALHMATATGGDWRHQPMRDDWMTWRENVLAAAAAATLFLTGVNALVQAVNTATDYGCKQEWWRESCLATALPTRR